MSVYKAKSILNSAAFSRRLSACIPCQIGDNDSICGIRTMWAKICMRSYESKVGSERAEKLKAWNEERPWLQDFCMPIRFEKRGGRHLQARLTRQCDSCATRGRMLNSICTYVLHVLVRVMNVYMYIHSPETQFFNHCESLWCLSSPEVLSSRYTKSFLWVKNIIVVTQSSD